MTFDILEDGTPKYTESFPDSLRVFYDSVKGYIYTCKGDYSMDNGTGIRHAAISEAPVDVVDCDVVDNAYERFLRYEREGKMQLRRFAELTQAERNSNRNMVLSAIRRLNLLEGMHPLSQFVMETYPDLWELSITETGKK